MCQVVHGAGEEDEEGVGAGVVGMREVRARSKAAPASAPDLAQALQFI